MGAGRVEDAAYRAIVARHANIPGQETLPGLEWPEEEEEDAGD